MSDDTVTFSAYRRPALAVGDYEITVTQSVSLESGTFGTSRRFSVGGDRFTLPPNAIRAVFPPEGSLGDHSNVLPHIVLDRPTLPWEREPVAGTADPAPWLALLLFDSDDRPEPRTTTLGALTGTGVLPGAATAAERHDSATDPVTVIEVPPAVLTDVLPGYADLRLLAHVRGGSGADGDVAVVVGNRLPRPGSTSTVHLVSLERRYLSPASGDPEFDLPHPGRGGGGPRPVTLISLASWQFACVSAEHSFPALVRDLAADGGTLRLPEVADPVTERYLTEGFVPVRHRLRQGGRSIGWYRGPLTVGPIDGGPVAAHRTADALLRFCPDVGMFDVSHAAAWQLGRLLALGSADITGSLYTWRRDRDRRAKQPVPADYPLAVTTVADGLPDGVLSWLRGLVGLDGVPLSYLLPDERLLPAESIRFVGVDNRWLRHLVDGATSVGRLSAADEARDAADPPPVEIPTLTGALIRSAIVPGYPGLLVDAYQDRAGTQPLSPWRIRRLTPDILLCLFAGELSRLDLHQPPEGQHLAVEMISDGTVGKTLRSPGGSGVSPGAVEPLPLGSRRTVPVRALRAAMADALGDDVAGFDSGDFALQLTETAQRVRFLRP